MARTAKNEKALTPEEKLAQALVPDVEQPYRVPENWCWVSLSSLVNLYNGDRGVNYPSKKDYVETGIPFINAGAIQDGRLDSSGYNYITQEKYDALRAGKVQIDDILYCLRGSLGKTAIVDFESQGAISSSLCILRASLGVSVKYLYYLLSSDIIVKQQGFAENGSAQPNLSAASVLQYKVPLAPLVEQQRIVDRIESLFAKLDEAKEKAQAVVDGFEDRRAAILHKAFTGELTRSWAEQEGISLDAWQTKRFDDVAEVKSNLVEPAEYPDFPHIAPDNIEKKTGKLLDYNTVAEDAVKSSKHRFFAGQILYSKIRPNLSKVVVIDFDGLCSADVYPIEPRDGVSTKFLWYYMLSDDFVLQASTAGSRSVLPKINQKELSSLTIQITGLKEQEKVVAVLDELFEKEQYAKEAAEQVIDQIDAMKKSILARAFRGELGTNDPSEESAVELVKRIISEGDTEGD